MAELFEYPSEDLRIWNGCQRNWDYSKPVEPEHVQRFIDIALSAPSKNNLNLLEMQVFENSLETQKFITQNAKGEPHEKTIKTSTEAPLTFFFGRRKGQSQWMREESPDDFLDLVYRSGGINEKFYNECMVQANMAAALIVGAISFKAHEFGYKTGINCCFLPKTKLYNSENSVFLSVGIGHPLYKDHSVRRFPNGLTPEEVEIAKEHGIEKVGLESQGPYRTKYKMLFTHIQNNVDITNK